MSVSLRDWIKGARNCNVADNSRNFNGNRDTMSPEYLESCLKIAISLSKQISDAEACATEKLRSLPIDISNWAGSIEVTIQDDERNEIADIDEAYDPSLYGGIANIRPDHDHADAYEPLPYNDPVSLNDDSATTLGFERLQDLFDFIREEDEIDSAEPLHVRYRNVQSTEIFINNSMVDTKSIGNSVDPQSVDAKQERIYALGLVFYELFTGRQLQDQEWHPSSVGDEHITLVNCQAEDDTVAPRKSNDDQVILGRSSTLNISGLLKLDGNEEVYGDDHRDIQTRPRKSHRASNPSIESLQLSGLSSPLCELIYNMLDSVSGDLRRDEAYTSMKDVTGDLQLMLDNPKKFLYDMDLMKLSVTGLQLKDVLFMRDQELASLERAYRRSTSGSSECAVIYGGSGTGKSFLAFRLGEVITLDGGLFLFVKFDQLKQANPFSALVSAFNDYCNVFTRIKESAWVQQMATKLRDTVGQDIYQLMKLLPKLSLILDSSAGDTAIHEDCVNGHNKINYLLTRFVEVICSCSESTMTLCLDDIQWADDFSLSVLQQIMIMPRGPRGNKQIFFMACYREGEMDASHPFKKMMDCSSSYGIRLTSVHLDCMNKDGVNRVVSDLLCLSPRIVRSLSEIVYHKTKGNPLFVSQFLVSLNREGLLSLSLSRRRWLWDEERIESRKLPNDVASFFSSSISRLPGDVQSALQTLSCFGAAVWCEVIEILESETRLKLAKPLEVAIDEGFICKRNEKYHFSHDQIQEAVYAMIKQEDRCLLHSIYGMQLVKVSLKTDLVNSSRGDDMLFTAVGQLNLAGPSKFPDSQQSSDIAAHNLLAGQKAMAMSDFTSALSFFSNGICFLKPNHWMNHYKLSLDLFELAAMCSLVLGDFANLTKASDQVLEHAHSFEDKLSTLFIVMSSLAYSSKMSESVAMGQSILSQLDHELPTCFTMKDIMFQTKQTQKDLSKVSDDALMNYKTMTDKRHIMAMKCLAKLELVIYQVDPDMQALITLKMVNITIDHGMCTMSAVGFAYFAGMLVRLGEMRDGHRLAKLAKALLDKDGRKEIAGDVIMATSEVLSYYEPFQTVNEYRVHGQAIALAAGDVQSVCVLKMTYCTASFWAGLNLKTVQNAFSEALYYIRGQNHLSGYSVLQLVQNCISVLVGEADEHELVEGQLTNPKQMLTFCLHKLFRSVLFNVYDDIKQYAENMFKLKGSYWFAVSTRPAMEFYTGLASFRVYRETGDLLWLDRGNQSKSTLQLWTEEGSSWNFQHKYYLLEAEEQFCKCDFTKAQISYSNAIASTRLHNFINDEALAYELAGYFYLSANMLTESLQHFTCAHEKYIEWGASSKVAHMCGFIQKKFGNVPTASYGSNILSAVAGDGQNFYNSQDSRKRRVP